jgi:APA family basic amino acid/polyamine antiporter
MENNETGLKRSISLPMFVFYGLGNTLGAGIYVLVGKVAGQAGVFAPLSFLVAAIVASMTAFSYAELSSRFPLSAGEAVYVQHGLGRRSLAIGAGAFVALSGIVSSAALARGFVGYLQVLAPVPDWIGIVAIVLILGGLAVWGVVQSVLLASLLTLVEVGGLLWVIWVGGGSLGHLPQRLHEVTATLGDISVWPGIMTGAFLAFYAFLGFEDMVNVAEEVKNARRNLPRGILSVLVLSTLLYASVALVAVSAVPPSELARAGAPLARVVQQANGTSPVYISLVSIAAVVNGALIQIIMVSRILYGMSRQGWLPPVFGRTNTRTHTPILATVLVSVGIVVFALWFPLTLLAGATSFLLLIVFTLVNLALVRIKRREESGSTVVTYPVWLPVVGFVFSLLLLLASLSGALVSH